MLNIFIFLIAKFPKARLFSAKTHNTKARLLRPNLLPKSRAFSLQSLQKPDFYEPNLLPKSRAFFMQVGLFFALT